MLQKSTALTTPKMLAKLSTKLRWGAGNGVIIWETSHLLPSALRTVHTSTQVALPTPPSAIAWLGDGDASTVKFTAAVSQ